jgi:hypothetical protein
VAKNKLLAAVVAIGIGTGCAATETQESVTTSFERSVATSVTSPSGDIDTTLVSLETGKTLVQLELKVGAQQVLAFDSAGALSGTIELPPGLTPSALDMNRRAVDYVDQAAVSNLDESCDDWCFVAGVPYRGHWTYECNGSSCHPMNCYICAEE